MSIVGTRVVRVEDQKLITTGGTYVEDLREPALTGAVHAVFVRSPIAHARIASIDTSAALEAPGVVAVYTAADLDLGPRQAGPVVEPWLASEVVRYVGEPVALVLTEQRYQLADAAELVDVDYDPLDAVASIDAALAGETVLYPDNGSNVMQVNGMSEFPEDSFMRLRSRGDADDREPARRPGAAGGAGRGARVGRGRAAHGVAVHAERAARPDGDRRRSRHRRGPRARGRARRRRRLRRQDRGRSRAHRARLGRAARRAPRAVERDAQREPDVDDARARPAEHRDDRRPPRRHRRGVPPGRGAGRRGLSADAVPADAHRADGLGRLPLPEDRDPQPRRGHQHHADRRLPRRGQAGGDRRDRAGDGPVRHRDRDGSRRGAPGQLHPARGVPVHHQVRRELRQRRVRQGARPGAGGRRLRGPAGGTAAATRGGRPGGARAGPRHVCRDHRW